MTRDAASRMAPPLTTRFEVLLFTSLFFAMTAIDSLFQLHNIGHPIAGVLLRSLLSAALAAGALHIISDWKRPS